jgi:tetratricopeptide (TPR) repeat protein
MKLRQTCYQLLFALILTLPALSQHRIVMKYGQVREAKIIGATGSSVQIEVGAGAIGIPIATIAQVVMPPPEEFNAAVQAFQAGDHSKALAAAQSVVEKYKGLPTEWAQQAASMVGEIYATQGDMEKAEAAFKQMQQLYAGQGSAQADVAMARLAVAKKEYDIAKEKLQPVADEALKELTPPNQSRLAYSQSFYLLGQVKEAQGDFAGALEDYLRTVTIFPYDRVAAASARERADALRKEHDVAVP